MSFVVDEPRWMVRPGEVYGHWTVDGVPFFIRIGARQKRQQHTVCKCKCGVSKVVPTVQLRSGHSTSCGCVRNVKHGMSHSRLYKSWDCMKSRCYNPNDQAYKNYGGRGIYVCDEWLNDFSAFATWALANGFRDGLFIDRFPDNDGPYSPTNCRWATHQEQANNRRSNVLLTAFGCTATLMQWSRDPRCVVSYRVICIRNANGKMTPEQILTTPSEKQKAADYRTELEPPLLEQYGIDPNVRGTV